ncbi:unnamed protein product [Timema podura]|uniref:Uncharacterized protein n=1 Tax=Timema podura TaxID=61482 RepID=A0ABN7P763_TIMPD|nr:unnamed protein product [Timema podura]
MTFILDVKIEHRLDRRTGQSKCLLDVTQGGGLKGEKKTDLDLLIKSERVCEIDEPLYQYQESGPFSVTFPPIKDEVNNQVVVNILNEGVSVLSMKGFRLNVYVKKIIVLNMLNEEGSVLNTVEPELNVKKKVVLNMLNEEGSVLNMVEPLVNVKRKVVLNIPEEGVSVIVMEDLLLNVKKEVVLNMLK